ncbi:MAG: RNA methyltransferase [Betaproteobacteria bacterium]|nr:RNA methyltransferase [Betaproteobacteria bacterium]
MNRNTVLDRVTVALSRTSHPGNIGSAARALKTMGFGRLTLIEPKHFPSTEAEALASGAADLLLTARVCMSLDEALAESTFCVAVSARARDLGPPILTARAAAEEIMAHVARGGEAMLLFGNEAAGLSNNDLQRCQRIATIPANPEYSSLNLAAAVQIMAYEMRQAAEAMLPEAASVVTPFSSLPATQREKEDFFGHLESVMRETGFIHPERPRRLMPKLRRLFARADLEKDEINILRGFLTACQEMLVSPKRKTGLDILRSVADNGESCKEDDRCGQAGR